MQIQSLDQQRRYDITNLNMDYRQSRDKSDMSMWLNFGIAAAGIIAAPFTAGASLAVTGLAIANAGKNIATTQQGQGQAYEKYVQKWQSTMDSAEYKKADIGRQYSTNLAQLANLNPSIRNLSDTLATLFVSHGTNTLINFTLYKRHAEIKSSCDEYYVLYGYFNAGALSQFNNNLKGYYQFSEVRRKILNARLPVNVIELLIQELEQGVRFI